MGFWSDTFGGGNSFGESVANVTTRDDDYEYRGGTLYGKDNKVVKGDQFGSDSKYGPLGRADSKSTNAYDYNLSQGNEGATPLGPNADSSRGGISNGLGAMMRSPVAMGGLGLMSGGIGAGLMTGAIAAGRGRRYDQKNPAFSVNRDLKADSEFRKKAAAQEFSPNFGRLGKEGRSFTKDELKQIREGKARSDTDSGRIEGAFFKDGDTSKQFKMNMFGNTYEVNPETGNSKLIEDQAAAAGGDNDGIAGLQYAPRTQATVATNTMPAPSAESEAAKQPFVAPPAEWLIANGYSDTNPSYPALLEYRKQVAAGVASMAKGGDVEFALGGNEKDLINAAERAVRNGLQAQGMAQGGELNLSNEDMIALAQYTQQYGKEALMELVDSVSTGSAQETRDRFARGDNGYVNGNGDGSGTDDKVPAKLKEGDSEQDVLLATKEFVFKESAATALENAGVSLDKINNAGTNAPKVLKEYFTG